ncbi:type VII secretion-associated protein [Mycobacterium decipiens]|uniref:Type VII secretion-associated protein n=1 Tax=Mycobacterium decipiens TaxID=1430326 RepID=A0A1X2M050_9MYCO|nr:type VII secretion-associated protein [Mycobacterium decipiens]OSC42973.1 type VII secretion-associated protein [Mycobacterium decipiens]
MNPHRAVIEAGPGAIRRLCCDTSGFVNTELSGTALGAIDDEVALLDERPVAVDSLWSEALRPLGCDHRDGLLVVHPSWWSASRVGVLTAAARTVAADVVVHPRSWLLRRAASDGAADATVVEIADRLVMVAGPEVVALARRTEAEPVAEEVARVVAGMARGTTRVVLLDGPSAVAGAQSLATLIADAVRDTGTDVVEIDDASLARLAGTAQPARDEPAAPSASRPAARMRVLTFARLAAGGVVLAVLTLPAVSRHGGTPVQTAPTTFLVDGRVALTVPANWPARRVVSGPGSARVQVTSPFDPEVALHVTQSPVPGETLTGTAQRLQRVIDAAPGGVFVDFNPADISAGRPAVTYREVRARHQVRWTVLLDGTVRISIGCQTGPGAEDAIRAACEQAVRSAHAVG